MNDRMRSTYPEVCAGGFTRVDGSIQFYTRVRSLVTERSEVLDFGAGRGKWTSDPVGYRRNLRHLKGSVRNVIGCDVDDAVIANPAVDHSIVMPTPEEIPLPDRSIDVLVADFVFEHVTAPAAVAQEIDRVLRPGGWVCARTPNRRGMTALAARIVPNSLHVRALSRLQPEKQTRDTFPTAYKLNTPKELRRYFPTNAWEHYTYTYDSEPGYAGSSRLLFSAMLLIKRISPSPVRETLMVFLRKRQC
jgi:SAM-dependent methyltransferase